MKNKKYELTDETINVYGHILHRIKALRDFSNVKAGDLGGYIEKEYNLDHNGSCWVYDDAKVYNNAKVYDNAIVHGNAEVFGDAKVFGGAWIYGSAEVYGYAEVFGDAEVHNNAKVYDNAIVHGNAEVFGDARVYGNAFVCGNARVCDCARVFGNARVCGDPKAYFNTESKCNNIITTKDTSIENKDITLLFIAEIFNEWLIKTSAELNVNKDDLQKNIHKLLN